MKAAYTIILASVLLFPLTFAAAERFGQVDCGMDICLPSELNLTPEQRARLQAIHTTSLQQREALRRQTREQILQLLTPEQAQVLGTMDGRRLERAAYYEDRPQRIGMHDQGDSDR